MVIPAFAKAVVPALLVLFLASSVAAGGGGTEVSDVPVRDRPAISLHGGVLHIAVAGASSARGIHLYRKSGGTWTHAQVTTGGDRQPSIAIRDDGAIFLAFWRQGTGCAEFPCSKGIYVATDASGAWVTTRAHAGDKDVHPSIGLDVLGKPWIDFRKGNQVWEVSRHQGVWSGGPIHSMNCCPSLPLSGPELVVWNFSRIQTFRDEFGGGRILLGVAEKDYIYTIPVTGADDAYDPELMIDANDDWHVAYRRVGAGLWHARDNGAGGVFREQVTATEVGPPSIARLPGGKLLVVASTDLGLIYRTNTTGSWTGGTLSSTEGAGWPVVVTTAAGAARVAYVRPGSVAGQTVWLVGHSPAW